MSIFQRIVLLLKVLVMLSLGTSAAWAANPSHPQGFSGVAGHDSSGLMIAKSESEGGDKDQGGSKDDDDSTTVEPDTDDDDEGDSQS
ncbi:hypothetical protein [Pseudomonas sp. NPDC096950]|uniref:hypothetical protein n=1 Tax=Pseudomonas sp. NPDC096950 TaxID=3364485 RepID=UPI00383A1029